MIKIVFERVENLMETGENAGYGLFFPCPRLSFPEVPFFRVIEVFTAQSLLITTLGMEVFENILVKGENADGQHFLLCPKCVLPSSDQISINSHFYVVVCKH